MPDVIAHTRKTSIAFYPPEIDTAQSLEYLSSEKKPFIFPILMSTNRRSETTGLSLSGWEGLLQKQVNGKRLFTAHRMGSGMTFDSGQDGRITGSKLRGRTTLAATYPERSAGDLWLVGVCI